MSKSETNSQITALRILVFSASLRKDSLNTKLIKLAANIIEKPERKLILLK